jgi:hypothetical protein
MIGMSKRMEAHSDSTGFIGEAATVHPDEHSVGCGEGAGAA